VLDFKPLLKKYNKLKMSLESVKGSFEDVFEVSYLRDLRERILNEIDCLESHRCVEFAEFFKKLTAQIIAVAESLDLIELKGEDLISQNDFIEEMSLLMRTDDFSNKCDYQKVDLMIADCFKNIDDELASNAKRTEIIQSLYGYICVCCCVVMLLKQGTDPEIIDLATISDDQGGDLNEYLDYVERGSDLHKILSADQVKTILLEFLTDYFENDVNMIFENRRDHEIDQQRGLIGTAVSEGMNQIECGIVEKVVSELKSELKGDEGSEEEYELVEVKLPISIFSKIYKLVQGWIDYAQKITLKPIHRSESDWEVRFIKEYSGVFYDTKKLDQDENLKVKVSELREEFIIHVGEEFFNDEKFDLYLTNLQFEVFVVVACFRLGISPSMLPVTDLEIDKLRDQAEKTDREQVVKTLYQKGLSVDAMLRLAANNITRKFISGGEVDVN
jgi:hypothetical protein